MKTALSPRKKPKQERSRIKFDKILSHAKKMLVEEGVDYFTTDALAKATGMSIGSIYQYFPNKQAIFSELINEWRESVESKLLVILDEVQVSSIESIPMRNQVLWQMIDRFYSELITTPEQLKLHAELIKASEWSIQLKELEHKHNQFISEFFIRMMTDLGTTLDNNDLIDLANYMYEAQNSIESSCKQDFPAYKRRMEWHKKASYALLTDGCFSSTIE
ncbi:TetR/AcrR family transcriptional regulator [Sessilibacter corallicola]|uniref:TetR/AcrR family transcriptional regulator n=1 Tax=Sessilibacter corallicola TaxID=2904075 RepID=UPI001E4DB46B|nr:TetR/AcrR family transcriptional regulator [Sessilibacter corallicola]MCE2029230.1 TetR/AcrR family transcriptional regulator [Sessilibacter corallicola]